MQKSNKTEFPR